MRESRGEREIFRELLTSQRSAQKEALILQADKIVQSFETIIILILFTITTMTGNNNRALISF